MKTDENIIIVAGGKGLRMGGDLPKQFIPIGEKPVLMHTLEAFYHYNKAINIVLVLPVSHQSYWADLCKEYNFTIPHTIANGGETRFHSVKNGLEKIKGGFVGVHDGVRPFASNALITKSFERARETKAVIPAIPSKDSLRLLKGEENEIIDRNKIVLIQTPQVFEYQLLQKAYAVDFSDSFTDDASVVENLGVKITLVEGEDTNIKITTPIDLAIAEVQLKG